MNLLGDHILAVFPPKKNVSETLFRILSLVYQGLNKLYSKFKKLRPVCRLTSVIVDTGMLFSYFERDFLAPCNVKPVVKPTGQHRLKYMNH